MTDLTRRTFLKASAALPAALAVAALARQRHENDWHRDCCKHCGKTGISMVTHPTTYCDEEPVRFYDIVNTHQGPYDWSRLNG